VALQKQQQQLQLQQQRQQQQRRQQQLRGTSRRQQLSSNVHPGGELKPNRQGQLPPDNYSLATTNPELFAAELIARLTEKKRQWEKGERFASSLARCEAASVTESDQSQSILDEHCQRVFQDDTPKM